MLLRKKAQSTAEYAITIGIVVAVVAGVMSVALKGGMRKKSAEATGVLTGAGKAVGAGIVLDPDLVTGMNSTISSTNTLPDADDFRVYESEARKTSVVAADYVDRKIVHKGGGESAMQQQTTDTTSLSVDSYNAVHP